MGAYNSEKILSRLIPKNHFCSMEFFREQPLINWPYTEAFLFTAYDLFRSNDYWLDCVISSGSTLKEALIELGLPRSKTLVADTGVFEMEAKKAGIAADLGIQIDVELSNSQIFEAYELSGADYFVAPDEIVLLDDNNDVVNRKIESIKENLTELLDIVPSSDIIAVIQGHYRDTIDGLFDFYRSAGITHFALGGAIPLFHRDRELLEKILRYTRKITKKYWLHVFGLPHLGLLQFYLHELAINSVDTSALLYLTARRRYVIDTHAIPVRNAMFENCRCSGCRELSPEMSTTSSEFFINLYVHNLQAGTKASEATTDNMKRASVISGSTGKPTPHPTTQEAVSVVSNSAWTTADKEYEKIMMHRISDSPRMKSLEFHEDIDLKKHEKGKKSG